MPYHQVYTARPLTCAEFARGLAHLKLPPLDDVREPAAQSGTYVVTFAFPPTDRQLALLAKAGVLFLRQQVDPTEFMMCLRHLPKAR